MKKSILIPLMLTSIFVACEKGVLDKLPLDNISEATLWNDETLVNAYLTQVYAEMTFLLNESSTSYVLDNSNPRNNADDVWSGMFLVNNISDETTNAWNGDDRTFKGGGLTIDGGLLEWWGYSTIRKLNEYISRIAESTLPEEIRDVKLAEGRFLRVMCYFAMVKRYGGIPLILEVQDVKDPEEVLFPKRDSEQDIYDFVIGEVDDIFMDLPETMTGVDLGRPSRYAALALKSRAALYAGSIAQYGEIQLDGLLGIPVDRADYYYQQSLDASEKIVADSKHGLYEKYPDDRVLNYQSLFTDKRNIEVIWARDHNSVRFTDGGLGIGYDYHQGPKPRPWSGNICAPYLQMVESYDYVDGTPGKLDYQAIAQGLWTLDELWGDKDPRFHASIYTQDTEWQGQKLQFYQGVRKPDGSLQESGSYEGILWQGNQTKTTGFGVLKYLDESYDGNVWGSSSTSWQIFRYGEVLLNLAEAAFELDQNQKAIDAVNRIRKRAGVKELTSLTRERLRNERKVELAFEGHRYWDVRRWRTAEQDLTGYKSGLRYVLDSGTRKYKLIVKLGVNPVPHPLFHHHYYYLPITLSRTGENPNLVENPDYR